MKLKLLALCALMTLPASAAITLSSQFGAAFDAQGIEVPDGTLWALVVDANNDSSFTGFGLNESLSDVNTTTPGIADSYFSIGQVLTLGGSINGNTIFALGEFNGTANGITGLWIDELVFNLGENNLTTGLAFAFYWFPEGVLNDATTGTISNQVGGIHAPTDNDAGLVGMFIPADGAFVLTGAANGDAGGAISNASFTAVTLIPEPSTALLGALGMLFLLRRRR